MDLEYQNISYTEPTFDEPFTDSKYTRVIWSIFSIVGICGNLFTISALIQSQTLKVQAATKFIISLATADLLFCSIILPINVIAQDLNETLCTFYFFLLYWYLYSFNVQFISYHNKQIHNYLSK